MFSWIDLNDKVYILVDSNILGVHKGIHFYVHIMPKQVSSIGRKGDILYHHVWLWLALTSRFSKCHTWWHNMSPLKDVLSSECNADSQTQQHAHTPATLTYKRYIDITTSTHCSSLACLCVREWSTMPTFLGGVDFPGSRSRSRYSTCFSSLGFTRGLLPPSDVLGALSFMF